MEETFPWVVSGTQQIWFKNVVFTTRESQFADALLHPLIPADVCG